MVVPPLGRQAHLPAVHVVGKPQSFADWQQPPAAVDTPQKGGFPVSSQWFEQQPPSVLQVPPNVVHGAPGQLDGPTPSSLTRSLTNASTLLSIAAASFVVLQLPFASSFEYASVTFALHFASLVESIGVPVLTRLA